MFSTSAAVFSLLLIVTGAAKVRRPGDVARALGEMGVRLGSWMGMAIGAVEIVVGVAAILTTSGLAVQGLLYSMFGGWVALALRRDVPLATCGCLGEPDTPPTVGHLLLNLSAAGLSFASVGDGPIRLAPGLGGVTQVVLLVLGVGLAYIVLTDGARLSRARMR